VTLPERNDDLAALRSRRGVGTLVLVLGEAGAGNAALVREFAAGEPVRWGACEALSTPRPLRPFLDLGLPRLDGDAGAREAPRGSAASPLRRRARGHRAFHASRPSSRPALPARASRRELADLAQRSSASVRRSRA
jgi:hypothetical protein